MPDLVTVRPSVLPLVMTAIHAGHDLRPAVAARIALDDATRLREEDPYTDRLTAAAGTSVVVHRSRFEVDLNRRRDGAVYSTPDTAWGLDVWRDPLPEEERAESLTLYDRFHAELALELDRLAASGQIQDREAPVPQMHPGLAVDEEAFPIRSAVTQDPRRPLQVLAVASADESAKAAHRERRRS